VGIAKDATNPRDWHEAGKPIQVLKQLEFCHRQSMAAFSQEEKRDFPRKTSPFSAL
jgi:hypothetical protein